LKKKIRKLEFKKILKMKKILFSISILTPILFSGCGKTPTAEKALEKFHQKIVEKNLKFLKKMTAAKKNWSRTNFEIELQNLANGKISFEILKKQDWQKPAAEIEIKSDLNLSILMQKISGKLDAVAQIFDKKIFLNLRNAEFLARQIWKDFSLPAEIKNKFFEISLEKLENENLANLNLAEIFKNQKNAAKNFYKNAEKFLPKTQIFVAKSELKTSEKNFNFDVAIDVKKTENMFLEFLDLISESTKNPEIEKIKTEFLAQIKEKIAIDEKDFLIGNLTIDKKFNLVKFESIDKNLRIENGEKLVFNLEKDGEKIFWEKSKKKFRGEIVGNTKFKIGEKEEKSEFKIDFDFVKNDKNWTGKISVPQQKIVILVDEFSWKGDKKKCDFALNFSVEFDGQKMGNLKINSEKKAEKFEIVAPKNAENFEKLQEIFAEIFAKNPKIPAKNLQK